MASATLPRCERIRKRIDFLSVQQRGRKLHSENFLLFVLPREAAAGRSPLRFGVTVTKKVGGAVVRNRIKRIARDVFRRHKSWFPTGSDVVLVAKQSAAGIDMPQAEREIDRLCARCFGAR